MTREGGRDGGRAPRVQSDNNGGSRMNGRSRQNDNNGGSRNRNYPRDRSYDSRDDGGYRRGRRNDRHNDRRRRDDSFDSRDRRHSRDSPHRRRTRSRDNNRSGRGRVPDFDTTGTDFVKISNKSETKAVAGKIAHQTRAGKAPTLLAIGPQSLNVAMKAIAVARTYLEDDDLDLSCQPAFREGMSDFSLAIYLHKVQGNRVQSKMEDEAEQLTSKAATEIKGLAGAIANRIREKKSIFVVASGSESVANAIGGICKARAFLEDDKLDMHCMPKFMNINRNGMDTNVLYLILSAEDAT